MKILKIKTNKREEVIDITNMVNDIIGDVKNGSVSLFLRHTSAALTINENDDPLVCEDFLKFLSDSIHRGKWKHDSSGRCDRNNGDAHLKAALIGHSEIIPVENGKLLLGKWQNIWLCEFDGPKEREIIVQKHGM